MKITNVVPYHLAFPLSKKDVIRTSQMVFDTRSVVVVKVVTDEGLVGWGESLGQPEVMLPVVEYVLKPLLVGQNPLDTGVRWSSMARGSWFRPQTAAQVEALSAVDIALWDIKGKALGQPISTLLGGAYRQEIPVYATGLYFDTSSALGEEANRHLANGFTAMKMKIGYPEGIRRDLERVKTVRDTIGPDVSLMVDANGKYDLSTAIAISQKLADFDVVWLEEPLKPVGPHHDLESYNRLKARTRVPVAWGEGQYLLAEVKDFLIKRAIDIIQPDVCRFGGLTESFRVSQLAAQFNIRFAPHFWTTGIGLAATLHLAAASEQHFICEYDQSPNPLRDNLTTTSFEVREGKVRVPAGPGLGVEINEEIFEQYCVSDPPKKRGS